MREQRQLEQLADVRLVVDDQHLRLRMVHQRALQQ